MTNLIDNKLFLIIFVSFIARIIATIIFGDKLIDMEWGILLNNLDNNGILSVRNVDGVPVPNIFMPPLYPIFLYVVKYFFSDPDIFLLIIKTLQIIFSLISIYLFYKILLEFYSQNISYIGTVIFSFFPLNIYSVSQISSISIQILLLNLFLLSFIKIFKGKSLINLIIFSISSGLLILLRGEFFVFVIFSLIYLFLSQKDLKKILLVLILTILVVSPYLVRNYQTFGVITVTKSAGYNLLKGNNPLSKVEGVGMFGAVEKVVPSLKSKLDELNALGPIDEHDLIKDKILLEQAVVYIKEDPLRYINLYFKKALSFIFIDIDSTYPNYYSIFNIIPKILISVTTVVAIFVLFKFQINLYNYFILYYLANIGLFSFFFILPRYNLSLLSIQILLSLYLLKTIKSKL
ncbi:MAG: hypothetical protein CBD57_01465 [Candidatus Pelagibacter sp. TMED197]|nr:hypothetical protein [Candidatus Pelagibacter sp.]OUW58920.1 MAG: hypothetical protein CBD57_01465 [Candidatus Pelagibacter sp. TMED197]|tara:strand:- start:835 stop:2049 length:1215 start_codon:yes stop_codon:yes gene_type:complete